MSAFREVVGLDLSLTATGVARSTSPGLYVGGTVKESGGIMGFVGECHALSTLSPPKDLGELERLDWIRHKTAAYAKELIVLEDFAFAAAHQAHQIGMLHGVVRMTLWKLAQRTPFVLVAPQALKKFITGKAGAKKEVILKEVYARWAVDTSDNNQADAVGLMYIGLALAGLWKPTTEPQREVIDALRKKNEKTLKGFGL